MICSPHLSFRPIHPISFPVHFKPGKAGRAGAERKFNLRYLNAVRNFGKSFPLALKLNKHSGWL